MPEKQANTLPWDSHSVLEDQSGNFSKEANKNKRGRKHLPLAGLNASRVEVSLLEVSEP